VSEVELKSQPGTLQTIACSNGKVFLVGAGPGDPELLTLKALRLLQSCDVVVYDNLVSQGVIALIPTGCEKIFVGKQTNRHTLPQDEINSLLVKQARQGRQVVRLKGGDPFIFGRGGEELETLFASHIPFEVVPGITAASGVASYAGIPLTHRNHAQTCIFTTGHLKDGTLNLDWVTLARPHQTVVIYMGLGALAEITRNLVSHGLCDSTPVAIIEKGTNPDQRVFTGTLATLAGKVADVNLVSPSLIIVGDVVALNGQMKWFDSNADSSNS
jgi:uroporphyrin-III C-methyltransferase/precorrin-2 dehydrogenase/sirohydrochlorin ferrochelatase